MWVFYASVLGLAVALAALNGGVGWLAEYFSQTTLIARPWAALAAGGLIATEALGAGCLVWPRTRRVGWIMVGALGGACAPFHAFALIVGGIAPCPCLGADLVMMGAWAHAIVGSLCLGLIVGAFVGAGAQHRAAGIIPAGETS